MQGIAGCIPAYCCACRSKEEAIERFVEMNDYCIDEPYQVMGDRRRKPLNLRVIARDWFPGTFYATDVDLYLAGQEDRVATLAQVLGNEAFTVDSCDCPEPWIHEEECDKWCMQEWEEWHQAKYG